MNREQSVIPLTAPQEAKLAALKQMNPALPRGMKAPTLPEGSKFFSCDRCERIITFAIFIPFPKSRAKARLLNLDDLSFCYPCSLWFRNREELYVPDRKTTLVAEDVGLWCCGQPPGPLPSTVEGIPLAVDPTEVSPGPEAVSWDPRKGASPFAHVLASSPVAILPPTGGSSPTSSAALTKEEGVEWFPSQQAAGTRRKRGRAEGTNESEEPTLVPSPVTQAPLASRTAAADNHKQTSPSADAQVERVKEDPSDEGKPKPKASRVKGIAEPSTAAPPPPPPAPPAVASASTPSSRIKLSSLPKSAISNPANGNGKRVLASVPVTAPAAPLSSPLLPTARPALVEFFQRLTASGKRAAGAKTQNTKLFTKVTVFGRPLAGDTGVVIHSPTSNSTRSDTDSNVSTNTPTQVGFLRVTGAPVSSKPIPVGNSSTGNGQSNQAKEGWMSTLVQDPSGVFFCDIWQATLGVGSKSGIHLAYSVTLGASATIDLAWFPLSLSSGSVGQEDTVVGVGPNAIFQTPQLLSVCAFLRNYALLVAAFPRLDDAYFQTEPAAHGAEASRPRPSKVVSLELNASVDIRRVHEGDPKSVHWMTDSAGETCYIAVVFSCGGCVIHTVDSELIAGKLTISPTHRLSGTKIPVGVFPVTPLPPVTIGDFAGTRCIAIASGNQVIAFGGSRFLNLRAWELLKPVTAIAFHNGSILTATENGSVSLIADDGQESVLIAAEKKETGPVTRYASPAVGSILSLRRRALLAVDAHARLLQLTTGGVQTPILQLSASPITAEAPTSIDITGSWFPAAIKSKSEANSAPAAAGFPTTLLSHQMAVDDESSVAMFHLQLGGVIMFTFI